MSWIGKSLVCLALIDCAAAAGDLYRIDPEHTYSTFEYTHWGLSHQRGRFDENFGAIEFDPKAATGAIDIRIVTASINTGSGMFDSILRSNNFFDAAHYPVMTFKSSVMHFDGNRPTGVDGALTIKDITRPVSFDITHFECRVATPSPSNSCSAKGFARILRSDFNIGRYIPFVSDEVVLQFSVEGIRE